MGAHIISRFVDRRFFLADDPSRLSMLDAITRAQRRWDWQWLSYALMSSHLHYGAVAGAKNPDRFFASAHTRFAQRFHRRAEGATLGPVFADRPTIHPIGRARLLKMVAYHHRNPCEAGVVQRPADSTWTSHRFYLRLDPAPLWLDIEWALDVLGFADTEAGRKEFDEFVIEVDLQDFVAALEPPGEPVLRSDPAAVDWAELIDEARALTGLPESVPLRSLKKAAVLTRWLVVRVATIDLEQSYAATATALGMTRGAVANLSNRAQPAPEAETLAEVLRRHLRLPA